MTRALAFALALASVLRGGALPDTVTVILPRLALAERQLQDATLDLQAARRDAEPAQVEVTEARAEEAHWWGRWRLRRSLAALKERLDKVEQARVAQADAHAAVFTILTGLEEELRSALEAALQRKARGPSAPPLEAWWRQKQAWSRRVEALEGDQEEGRKDGAVAAHSQLLAEARLEQLDRDRGILEALAGRGILAAPEAALQRRELMDARRRWKAVARRTPK